MRLQIYYFPIPEHRFYVLVATCESEFLGDSLKMLAGLPSRLWRLILLSNPCCVDRSSDLCELRSFKTWIWWCWPFFYEELIITLHQLEENPFLKKGINKRKVDGLRGHVVLCIDSNHKVDEELVRQGLIVAADQEYNRILYSFCFSFRVLIICFSKLK